MNKEDVSFNLISEPWISCITLGGKPVSLSLKEIFDQAHELREFDFEHPLTTPALMGILHCIIYRATAGPKDIPRWSAMWKEGRFGANIQDYLKAQSIYSRFDLFSPIAPFYQTKNLASLDAAAKLAQNLPVVRIVQQLASGNNRTVFDHTLDRDTVSLAPAQAALALITYQNAALQGLISKKNKKEITGRDAQLSTGMVIMLKGRNLFDMIMLNLLPRKDNYPIPSTKEDGPVWDLDPKAGPSVGVVSVRGYMHLLTPQCRHILLKPEITDSGQATVRWLDMAQGEAFRIRKDTRFVYDKPKREGYDGLPKKMQSSRILWRDSEALFGMEENRPEAITNVASAMEKGFIAADRLIKYVCSAHGMVSKNAKISDWRTDRLQVPASIFVNKQAVQELLTGIDIAEKVASHMETAIKKAAFVILPGAKKAKDDRKKLIKYMLQDTETFYWQRLDLPFYDFVLSLPDEGSALKDWFSILRKNAENALTSEFETMSFDPVRHMPAWVKAEETLKNAIDKTGKQKGVI